MLYHYVIRSEVQQESGAKVDEMHMGIKSMKDATECYHKYILRRQIFLCLALTACVNEK